jgi:hypothetical protein
VSRGFVGAIALIVLVSVIVIPNLRPIWVIPLDSPHAHAIGALKQLNTQQFLFREGGKDEDGSFQYGSLRQLGEAGLIDAELASGTKGGYLFQLAPAPETPEFLWMAVANPAPGGKGENSYCINQSGVVFYTDQGPLQLDPACEIPAHCLDLSTHRSLTDDAATAPIDTNTHGSE